MLGLAAGDALGCPVEGLKAGHRQQLVGRVQGYVDPLKIWAKQPWRWRMPGLYSDDTQQAIYLADTLVRCHGFDPGFFARLLLRGAESQAHRGAGPTFNAALKRLGEGVPAEQAGGLSAGMGAAMRAAPVGLYYADRQEELTAAAVKQGLVTHRDPRALALAAAVAFAVARGASGAWEGLPARERIAELAEEVARMEKELETEFIAAVPVEAMDMFGRVRAGVENFRRYLELERRLVWSQVVNEANRHFPTHKITEPGDPFALAGGMAALFVGVAAESLEDGLLELIALGKDTDTMGAIAGGILGSRMGEEAIPLSWREGLQNYEQVALRGEGLLAKSFQGLRVADPVEMEAKLTLAEAQERERLTVILARRGEIKPPEPRREKAPLARTTKAKAKPPAAIRKGKRQKPARVKAPWRGGKDE
jgi:ADP-ribosylglycohydrolase